MAAKSAQQFYAETYDTCVGDWPGEVAFYSQIARQRVEHEGGSILELGCGTGRITTRLAQEGFSVVGLDASAEMLHVARTKAADPGRVRWVLADMRSFDLEETFDLVLIPGHSFQFMITPDDQAACLRSIRNHLAPGGTLVVHLDHMGSENVPWLAEISGPRSGHFETQAPFEHPRTGRVIQSRHSWAYDPLTQTATGRTIWEELGEDGEPTARWDSGPVRLHCVFRFEMEHLLIRTGFNVEAIYGDFDGQALENDSSELIWVARDDSPVE